VNTSKLMLFQNAEIQLTIFARRLEKTAVGLEVELCNMTKITGNDQQNVEVGFHFEGMTNPRVQTDVNFVKALGNTKFFLAPFVVDQYTWTSVVCRFQLVLKVPYDLTGSSTDMSKLFNNGDFSDVKIMCNGHIFRCHKSILAFKSDVFKAMFNMSKCTEQINGKVQIDDIEAKTMETVIKYMYQNKITFREATDLNVLIAANKYNVVDLVLKCEENILLNLSMTNVLDILAIGHFLPTPNIFDKAMAFFRQIAGRQKVREGQKWLELKSQNPDLAQSIFESCLNIEKCENEEEEFKSEAQD
jgi:hypothetical protein